VGVDAAGEGVSLVGHSVALRLDSKLVEAWKQRGVLREFHEQFSYHEQRLGVCE